MGEIGDRELKIVVRDQGDEDAVSSRQLEETSTNPPCQPDGRGIGWWLLIASFIVFVVLGQGIVALLGRLYYDKGGKSKWLMTLLQLVGFPVLLPLYYYTIPKGKNTQTEHISMGLKVLSIYTFLGLFTTGLCLTYSMGLQYLPVSTFTLIIASQLAFNAFFSFFLNSQKFTPYIVNSLVLLTVSSTLLVFNSDSSLPKGVSKSQYHLGFVYAILNAAACGLFFPLTEFTIKKVVKIESFKVILDLTVISSFAASLAAVVGLFASGEWRSLNAEMDGFELGKFSYLMTLFWLAVTNQVFLIGVFGLILKVSPLFSNVAATFGLPIVQVFAVIFFHDSMSGIKVISILLAIWGFVSYGYQQYLDYYQAQTTRLEVLDK